MPAEHIQKLVTSFPRTAIDKLMFSTSEPAQNIEDPETPLIPQTNLIVVPHIILSALGEESALELASMLSCTIEMDQVRRLDLQGDEASKYQFILDAVSAGLQELHFNMEPFPRTYRIGSGREVPVIRSCSMLQSVRVAFSVGGTPAADYWRWHAQNLCAFISQARVSASAYPHLRTFVISIKVGAAEDQRVPLPEIASSLDETLVYLVRETSLQSVAFEWVRSTKWRDTLEGDEFADYIYKTFPVLRRDNRVTIQAPIRKGL